MKLPQRKPHKVMSEKEMEHKIIQKYGKIDPQPTTLKEKVVKELNKLK